MHGFDVHKTLSLDCEICGLGDQYGHIVKKLLNLGKSFLLIDTCMYLRKNLIHNY